LASIYFDAGDFQKALDSIQKALEIDPQNPQLQNNLKVIEAKMQGQ
jgi:Tfp pilus assembly protein PilF